jgi:hypothetical protein
LYESEKRAILVLEREFFAVRRNGMKRVSTVALGLFLCIAWAPALFAQAAKSEAPALVGRITLIENGQLLRYVYAEKDWVATVKDAPFGLEDAVYAGDTTKAEFKLPNGTWIRIGGDTQIQLIALREDVTEIDTASGTARFYNKSSSSVIKATTPFGYVLAQPGTAFDIYVGDSSAEVISLDGRIEFVLKEGTAKYTIEAGGASIISDGRRAVEGDGMVDADWDTWNLKREELWTQRVQVKGESVSFLPPALQDDGYDLDQNGRWEHVYYAGEYRTLWRPTVVAAEWQPFTGGRWTVWNEDNVWIPEENFGYVTHHYGNWVYVDGAWFWAPPVVVRVGYLGGGVYWCPGRVSWIYSGVNVGWVPLAPTEVYYSHHYWGPTSVVVGARVGVIGIGGLAYVNHAVIVNQANFYSVNNYSSVRVANVSRTTIVNTYRASPVVNNTVISNYSTMPNRFVYNTQLASVAVKPHQSVVGRINYNRTVAVQESRGLSASSVQSRVARIRTAVPVRGAAAPQVQRPTVSSRMVPANQVNAPGTSVHFNSHQLKVQGKQPQITPRAVAPGARPGAGGVRQPAVSGGQRVWPGTRPPGGVQQPRAGGERGRHVYQNRPAGPQQPGNRRQQTPRFSTQPQQRQPKFGLPPGRQGPPPRDHGRGMQRPMPHQGQGHGMQRSMPHQGQGQHPQKQ